jgi:hypothetical protein
MLNSQGNLSSWIAQDTIDYYYLFVLHRSNEFMKFTQRQIRKLNVCWNTEYRGYCKVLKDDSEYFIHDLGKLKSVHIIKFYRS